MGERTAKTCGLSRAVAAAGAAGAFFYFYFSSVEEAD
jgi:hypothetical protein